MGALTATVPKPMLPIQGKPKLEHSLSALPDGVTEIILVVGYLGDVIKKYFGTIVHGKPIRYVEQRELNGSGGAIHLVKDMVEKKFLVLMGDDLYLRSDIERLMTHDLAILAYEMKDSSQFGVLEIDSNGKLVRVIERPHAPEYTLVNTAAYALNKSFFEYPLVPVSDTEFGLPQTLAQMKDKYSIMIERAEDWLPIGDPEALAIAQTRIQDFLV